MHGRLDLDAVDDPDPGAGRPGDVEVGALRVDLEEGDPAAGREARDDLLEAEGEDGEVDGALEVVGLAHRGLPRPELLRARARASTRSSDELW